jgi:long-chain acyl-CoA synthetase
VIGIPDPRWGEAVHVVVVVRAGTPVDAADLISFCKKRIAGYKCPHSVDVRTAPLPMSGAGKILKRELRRPFWEGKDRHVA